MDRQIILPQAIPLDTDILSTNKNAMVALGMALQAILGTSTCVAGLPCTPTLIPSLNVLIGQGSIHSVQNIDGTAYGSLAADTADQIVKQGILLASQAITLATPAPVTGGQSINYLIEAAYQDVDTTPVVLNFYNSANPLVPFVGVGGLGGASNTQRKGTVVVQVKAGTSATTGTQTTPAPDSGFVGLYAVTVANGQSTVTSSNITQVAGAPFLPSNLASPMVAIQLANLSLTSTTLANTSLALNLGIGNYAIEGLLNFNGVTTGTQGIKFGIGGTAVFAVALGVATGVVNSTPVTSIWAGNQTFATIDVATSVAPLAITHSINVTTPGTYILQAAQNSASANATQFLLHSYLTARKVG